MFVWTSVALGLILSVLAALPGLLGTFDADRQADPTVDLDPSRRPSSWSASSPRPSSTR
jgi:hypothetical protein